MLGPTISIAAEEYSFWESVDLSFLTGIRYGRPMHLKRASAAFTLFCASLSLMLETVSVRAQERMTPDKQWEYQCSAGVGPQIVKAGTTEVALDLSDALPSENNGLTANKEAEPVWAPDSKRVAFNYILHEHRSNGWGTTVLFELRNDKWVFLRSPVDSKEVQAPDPNYSNRDQLAQLAKKYLPKHSYNRAILKSPATGDFLKVVSWTDADTAVFWAFSSDADAGASFELKIDAKGNWKLVKAKVLSGEAAEKQQE
jgi:hypothetical protein